MRARYITEWYRYVTDYVRGCTARPISKQSARMELLSRTVRAMVAVMITDEDSKVDRLFEKKDISKKIYILFILSREKFAM